MATASHDSKETLREGVKVVLRYTLEKKPGVDQGKRLVALGVQYIVLYRALCACLCGT